MYILFRNSGNPSGCFSLKLNLSSPGSLFLILFFPVVLCPVTEERIQLEIHWDLGGKKLLFLLYFKSCVSIHLLTLSPHVFYMVFAWQTFTDAFKEAKRLRAWGSFSFSLCSFAKGLLFMLDSCSCLKPHLRLSCPKRAEEKDYDLG